MAAAVADYRPETRSDSKIKKSDAGPPPLRLVQNPDILRELSSHRARPGQVIVGFGAETGDVLANGRAKLAAKGCDLLVVNQVGGGLAFGTSDNEAVVLAADGTRDPGAARAQGSARRGHLGSGGQQARLAARQRLDCPATLRARDLVDFDENSLRRDPSERIRKGSQVARRLFTSESVTEGHPDKMADQISDAILDGMLKGDPASHVAVETLITTGQVHVAGEVTTETYVDIPGLIREKILEIGYDSSAKGYDGASCGVSVSIGSQSPDIAQGVRRRSSTARARAPTSSTGRARATRA